MQKVEKTGMLSVAPEGATEVTVIEESTWGAVKALWERGIAKKAIARELGLDIKTVRHWCREAWQPQKRERKSSLAPWDEFLRARGPEVGFNAAVLHRELAVLGFTGAYVTVAKYVGRFRDRTPMVEPATVRFETEPGKQAQVDWGTLRVYLGGEQIRVHVFVMTLGFSRRTFCKAYSNEGVDSLLDGHASAFAHFGGRTTAILYDNPRTIVLGKDEATGAVRWNEKFKDRMDHYGADLLLCRYYRPQTKGKVESTIKYVKGNALVGRIFRDFDDLNEWLACWCLTVADQREHGTTHELPAVRFEREREFLISVDTRPPAPRERVESRIVHRDGFVSIDANLYPLSLGWAGLPVEVRIRGEEVLVSTPSGETIRHVKLKGRHHVASWDGPPRQLPERQRARLLQGPPRYDPVYGFQGDVESRQLESYQDLVGELV